MDIRVTIDNFQRDESEWAIFTINGDLREASFNRAPPPIDLGPCKRVIPAEVENYPHLPVQRTRRIVDAHQF